MSALKFLLERANEVLNKYLDIQSSNWITQVSISLIDSHVFTL